MRHHLPIAVRQLSGFVLSVAVHAVVFLMALSWEPGATAEPARAAMRAIELIPLPPADDPNYPGLNLMEPAAEEWAFPDTASTTFSIDDFKFDVDRIAERAELLFPFLTPGVALDHFALKPRTGIDQPLGNPLLAEKVREKQAAAKPPLVLSERALQRLVDETWARRHRWTAFEPIAKLARAHDPDAGALPALVQQYRDQNWLQPYEDAGLLDPRLWTELGLTTDHVDFIGFIRQYASGHPSTKTTIELLFLLDAAAQSSRNLLETLMDTDPAEDLVRTQVASPRAHELVSKVKRQYEQELRRRRLTTDGAVTAFYDKVRVEILTGILRTTPDGYRASDARYLLGTIFWKAGLPAEALRWWRDMDVDESDSHVASYSSILAAIRAADARLPGDPVPRGGDLGAEIARILVRDHRRWVVFSYDRLDHFGYTFDTF